MAATDAKAIPKKNTALRITVPIMDADGDLVSGATGLDSEVSKDGGAFADCTNEATEIGSSGMYTLDLTSTEMNADTVVIIVKTSTSGAKTMPIVLYTAARSINDLAWPQTSGQFIFADGLGSVNVATLYPDALNATGLTTRKGTAQAGGSTTITLDAAALATDNIYVGQMVVITGGTGAGQPRMITGYVGSTKVATVGEAWVTNPSATSTFVLVPNRSWTAAMGTDVLTSAALATTAVTELRDAIFARTGFTEPTAPPTFASSFDAIMSYILLWGVGEIDATTAQLVLRNIADTTDVATHVTSDVAGVFVNAAAT